MTECTSGLYDSRENGLKSSDPSDLIWRKGDAVNGWVAVEEAGSRLPGESGDEWWLTGKRTAPLDEILIASLRIHVTLGLGEPMALQLMTVPVEFENITLWGGSITNFGPRSPLPPPPPPFPPPPLEPPLSVTGSPSDRERLELAWNFVERRITIIDKTTGKGGNKFIAGVCVRRIPVTRFTVTGHTRWWWVITVMSTTLAV